MLTLIVMAGGMGSRFGGLKQLEPFGPSGEKIIDFTVYDAVKAEFDRVVFVIKEENLELFKKTVSDSLSDRIKVDFVFQSTDKLPDGFEPIQGREKPLGTGHAVWCCRKVVNEPFCVVNADDYYGRQAFVSVAEFLKNQAPCDAPDVSHYCMAGFELGKTLTENGDVSRGVCVTDKDGMLMSITENPKISIDGKQAVSVMDGKSRALPLDTTVSMNFWGFTPDFFGLLEKELISFLSTGMTDRLKSEFYLPFAVDKAMQKRLCDVKVLSTPDAWHGVTYKQDVPGVKAAFEKLFKDGAYPSPLFG